MEKDKIQEVYNYCYEDKFQAEDLEQRRLFLNDEIDCNIIDSCVYQILRYNRIDRGIPKDERKPIILYINTPGGSVFDGFGLIDTILQSETPVYTVNLALCASMGFLIFIAGEKRFSMPHSTFLMHDGSTFGFDSTAKMKDRMEFETTQLAESIKQYILGHTKIDEKLYDEKYRVEWYFLPELGKEIGVIDYILGKDCRINEII